MLLHVFSFWKCYLCERTWKQRMQPTGSLSGARLERSSGRRRVPPWGGSYTAVITRLEGGGGRGEVPPWGRPYTDLMTRLEGGGDRWEVPPWGGPYTALMTRLTHPDVHRVTLEICWYTCTDNLTISSSYYRPTSPAHWAASTAYHSGQRWPMAAFRGPVWDLNITNT